MVLSSATLEFVPHETLDPGCLGRVHSTLTSKARAEIIQNWLCTPFSFPVNCERNIVSRKQSSKKKRGNRVADGQDPSDVVVDMTASTRICTVRFLVPFVLSSPCSVEMICASCAFSCRPCFSFSHLCSCAA